MARDYDAQLLESVGVRRRRLRDALLLGHARIRRSAADNLTRVIVSCVVAAALCAGCVGWAFVSDALAKQKEEQEQRGSLPAVLVDSDPIRSVVPA